MTKDEWVCFYFDCCRVIGDHFLPCPNKAEIIRLQYPTLAKLAYLSELELLILANLILQDSGSDVSKAFVDEDHLYYELEDDEFSQADIRSAGFRLQKEGIIECFVHEDTGELSFQPKNHALWLRGVLTIEHEELVQGLKFRTPASKQVVLN